MSKLKRLQGWGRKDWLVGIVLGLVLMSPALWIVFSQGRVTAPLNILSGCCDWRWQPDTSIFTVIPSDVTDFVLPDRAYVSAAYRVGQIALWNPKYFGGEVFMANTQSEVLNPLNLFLLVFDELDVQSLSTLLSLALAITLMYYLLRQLRVSRISSAVAASAYGLSNFLIFWSTFGMMTWVMAFMPGVIALYLSWTRKPSRWKLPILSLVLGLQFYFGHIQFPFMLFLTLALFILARIIIAPNRIGEFKANLLPILAMIAGGLIGAAQILPFLAQTAIGHRTQSAQLESLSWAARYEDIKAYLQPFWYEPNDQAYYMLFGPFRFTIGLLPGIAAIFAALSFRKYLSHMRWFFVFITAFGLFWSWGSWPQQLAGLIVPQFKQLNPRYFFALAIFGSAILAGFGFDDIRNLARRISVTINSFKESTAIIYGAAITAALASMLLLNYIILRHQGHLSMHRNLLATVLIAGMCLLALVVAQRQWQRSLSLLVVGAFIIIQSLQLFFTITPLPKKSLLAAGNPMFDKILADEHPSYPSNIRIVSPYSPNSNEYYGFSTLNGYDALYASTTEKLIDAINYPNPTMKLSQFSHNAIYVENNNKPAIMQTLGVEYIVAKPDEVVDGYSKVMAPEGYKFALYKSDRPAEQVFFAQEVTAATIEDQLKAFHDGSLGYRQVIASDNPDEVVTNISADDSVNYQIIVNRITANTQSLNSKLLFIGQTYRPNWVATIDGKPATIIRANYNFMAVVVPPGSHRVALTYHSKPFILGLIISGFIVVSIILWFSWPRIRLISRFRLRKRQ